MLLLLLLLLPHQPNKNWVDHIRKHRFFILSLAHILVELIAVTWLFAHQIFIGVERFYFLYSETQLLERMEEKLILKMLSFCCLTLSLFAISLVIIFRFDDTSALNYRILYYFFFFFAFNQWAMVNTYNECQFKNPIKENCNRNDDTKFIHAHTATFSPIFYFSSNIVQWKW